MVSFEEYYNNRLNEAAVNTFDEMIKLKGNAFKTSKLAKTKAKEIINQLLKDKELKQAFMHDAEQGTIKTDTDEYKNLALAISVLAANKDQTSKDYLRSLGITPKEDEKVKDLQVIKNINAGTKPLIKSIRATNKKSGEEVEQPENQEPETKNAENQKTEPETPEDKETKPETPENDKKPIIVTKTITKKDKNKVSSEEDERSPSFFLKQAREVRDEAIEEIRKRAEKEPNEVKKVKVLKAARDLERAVNKQINNIEKQEDRYSNYSNFGSKLKATRLSGNGAREVERLAKLYKDKAFSKTLRTASERDIESIKSAGRTLKKGFDKIAGSRTAQKLKDEAIRAAKKSKDIAKRGAEVAAPIIKSTTDKVVDKIKTTTSDAIIKKWYPEKFKDFVNSDDPKVQAEILKAAKEKRDKANLEASKRRRLAKAKMAPNVVTRKNSEEKTLTDIPTKKYPDQINTKIG